MGRDSNIHIEWDGLQELGDLLETMEEEIERIALEEYRDFGMLFEEAVRALAPRDESDLEGSYNVAPPKREGEAIVIEGGSNSKYALRRHEEPYRMGTYPKYDNGSKFPDFYVNGRGARTRSKPGFRGEKAGRKYQSRAVELITEDWNETNQRILDRVLGAGGGSR